RAPPSRPRRGCGGPRSEAVAAGASLADGSVGASMADAPETQRGGGRATLRGRVVALRSSDVGRASGLAVAMIANNVVALGSTVVFARLLDDYGSLAALISFYLILSVVGQALQVATARDAVLGQLGEGPVLLATMRSWTRSLLLLTAALAVVS